MNYKAHYEALMRRAGERELTGYRERHHVLPRSLGGNDSAWNLVDLTAREHYTAHLLLVKMHPGNAKLVYAAHMMTVDRHGHRVGNRKYEWLRRAHSAATSAAKRGNTHTLGRKWSKATKVKMSEAAKARAPTFGTECSPEKRAKLAAANRGKPLSQSHVAAMIKARAARVSALPKYTTGEARVMGIIQLKNGLFKARARVRGERRYLGCFVSLDQAKMSVDSA